MVVVAAVDTRLLSPLPILGGRRCRSELRFTVFPRFDGGGNEEEGGSIISGKSPVRWLPPPDGGLPLLTNE